MAGDDTNPTRTPARQPAKAAASISSSAKQKSIMSFFQKSSPAATPSPAARKQVSSDPSSCLKETKANLLPKAKSAQKLSTPVPSSDAIEPSSSQENLDAVSRSKHAPSSPTMALKATPKPRSAIKDSAGSSPGRKVSQAQASIVVIQVRLQTPPNNLLQSRKAVSYAESSEDDEPVSTLNRRRTRTRPVLDDEDEYGDDGFAEVQDDEGEPYCLFS
jgi:DNA mismatch repair protein MSH6